MWELKPKIPSDHLGIAVTIESRGHSTVTSKEAHDHEGTRHVTDPEAERRIDMGFQQSEYGKS